jgi:RNA polymerase sigma-70 factor, ECF subfamily
VTAVAAVCSAEVELVHRLRRGEESAFLEPLDTYGSALLRLAMSYVGSRAVAEEVVHETWIGVLRGLEGFERAPR